MIISGLKDLRAQLPRNSAGGPRRYARVADKFGAVVHYFGPPVQAIDELAEVSYFRAIAHDHAFRRDWSPAYGLQNGDGIMYHLGIGRRGDKYLLRDLGAVLWHCGTPLNASAFAIHVILGGDQRATPAQLAALGEVCADLEAAGRLDRRSLWGHRELGTTASCPGTLMEDFVYPWRARQGGGAAMADGRWFSQEETGQAGHYVGHAFWQFWDRNGGLRIFGYPLTDELQEVCPDGVVRTVQYFERAVFEYHLDQPDEWKVQLRLIGAEALARKAE